MRNKEENLKEIVALAYQAVTTLQPTEEIVGILESVGIRRTLEVLIVLQQSPTVVRNVNGFIKKAIIENWTPETVAIKIPRKKQQSLIDLNNKEYGKTINTQKLPFYNWLDD